MPVIRRASASWSRLNPVWRTSSPPYDWGMEGRLSEQSDPEAVSTCCAASTPARRVPATTMLEHSHELFAQVGYGSNEGERSSPQGG
jgi:hypothetical protein